MRQLTFLETGYLCVGLLLCMVLPLLMSYGSPKETMVRRVCMRIVWTGQGLLAIAGLAVLASAAVAPYAAAVGMMGYIACTSVLVRQLRCARNW
jgi:hypothetical protein